MRASVPSDTVVVGVGNSILSDDGVGVHAARLLESDPRVPASVTILDGGTIGLELLPYVSDASRVLFLDAVNSGSAPGTLARMTGKELLGTAGGCSAHQLGVADLIAALFLVSAVPQEIVVLGVQPAYTDWGTTLTPERRGCARAFGRSSRGAATTVGGIADRSFGSTFVIAGTRTILGARHVWALR